MSMKLLRTISGVCGQCSRAASANSQSLGSRLLRARGVHDFRKRTQDLNQASEEKVKVPENPDRPGRVPTKKLSLKPGEGYIPTAKTYAQTFEGVRYDELPTAHFTCSRNNTQAWFEYENKDEEIVHCDKSSGLCGYKNAKKSSNAAAQTVGYQIGRMMHKRKLQNIRVEMRGNGNQNKFPALRGLVLGGVNIVAVQDNTYPNFQLRPRHKLRK